MKHIKLILTTLIIGILISGCISGEDEKEDNAKVELVYMSGCGTMPSALANGQLDAYFAWQPIVSVGEIAGIGKVITYSENLPPEDKWTNHPCCSLVATDSLVSDDPELASYITMLLIYADEYIETHEIETAQYCADWLFGGDDLNLGDIVVDSETVERASIETISFMSDPTATWKQNVIEFVYALEDIELITSELSEKTEEELDELIFEDSIYETAYAMIETNSYLDTVPEQSTKNVSIGYLPSDHDAALFVAAYNWSYFKDEYGIYLNPIDEKQTYELVVNDTVVATVSLVEFSGGSAAMTAASQGNVDYCIVGVPPAVLFIDQGAPVSILAPVQTEGSGIVVPIDAPYDDWDGFIEFIKDNYKEGNTIKIGDPMIGSIQDVMIKYALTESGIEFE